MLLIYFDLFIFNDRYDKRVYACKNTTKHLQIMKLFYIIIENISINTENGH